MADDLGRALGVHEGPHRIAKQPNSALRTLSPDQEKRLGQLTQLLDNSRTYLREYAKFVERYAALGGQTDSPEVQHLAIEDLQR